MRVALGFYNLGQYLIGPTKLAVLPRRSLRLLGRIAASLLVYQCIFSPVGVAC
ncbi:hypothetical protein M2315_003067 [Agrobacterium fabrum]|nr:hypothetical protein [Agrobacterium fabrum]